MAETPAEQRLERRGLEGTGDLSAVLGEMDDEDAEDARLRKELDERKRRRDEERSLALERHAARDAGRAAHVPGEGAARRTAMEQSESDSEAGGVCHPTRGGQDHDKARPIAGPHTVAGSHGSGTREGKEDEPSEKRQGEV